MFGYFVSFYGEEVLAPRPATKLGEQWRTEGVGFGGFNPPPEIPKALQNRAKLNLIVQTVKNCRI